MLDDYENSAKHGCRTPGCRSRDVIVSENGMRWIDGTSDRHCIKGRRVPVSIAIENEEVQAARLEQFHEWDTSIDSTPLRSIAPP